MKTKKVTPSGVGCRMYAATKSKPRFLKSLFMLLIAVLASTMSVFGQINWASLGEAPAASTSYYIYNTSANCFMVNNGSNTNASVTSDPASVEGKYFTTSNNMQFTIRLSNSNRTTTLTLESGTEYSLKYTSNNRTYYFLTNNGSLTAARNNLGSTNYQHWIFIPESEFNAQKNTLYFSTTAAYADEAQSSFGTIQVSLENTNAAWNTAGLTVDKTDGVSSFGSTATVYFKATPAGSDYRFLGWKANPSDADYVSTNATYTATFDASTDAENPTSYQLYAVFQKKHTIYAKAVTGANAGGSAKVSFSTPIPGEATTEVATNINTFEESYNLTAYFEATEPEDGFEFVGWARDAFGLSYISGAINLTYSEQFAASSLNEAAPTIFERYAIYKSESMFAAQVVHYTDEGEVIVPYITLAEAISAAVSSDKVQLLKNITLSEPIVYNLNRSITLDLNGYSLTGSGVTNMITLASGALIIADGNQKPDNGIFLSAATADAVSAMVVTDGTLTFAQGRMELSNSSTGVTSGVLVNGGTFVMQGNGGTMEVNAANGYGVQVVSGAEATLAQGTITAKGGSIGVLANGTVKITHSIQINASTSSSTIGVRMNNAAANVTIDGGLITANTYAIQAQNGTLVCERNMEAKATATSGAYALKQEGSADVTVWTGRFHTPTNNAQDVVAATAAKLKLHGGYYVHNTALDTYKASEEVGIADLKSGNKFYTAGYRYVMSEGDNPNYVAYTADSKNFSSLEDALDYANVNPTKTMTILQVVPDYELPAGNYTLPANATLLVPYMGQTAVKTTIERIDGTGGNAPYIANTLTFATGANLNVYGAIEVGGKQMSGAQGATGAGVPRDSHGLLVMEAGSHMTMSGSSAVLRAWGFVIGAGTIDVRRGAKVYEQFQMYDWKGGSYTSAMVKSSNANRTTYKVFPVTQYFIQNVECATTYHPGSELISCTSVYVSSYTLASNTVNIIGTSGAMFLMKADADQENTWVKKWYDVEHDQQVYEINSSASLGSMTINFPVSGIASLVLSLAGYGDIKNFSSTDYTLPVTNNMKIHLLTGDMEITQSTVMLPGAQIEIDKEATVSIKSGKTLYLHDSEQWGQYTFSSAWAQRIGYRPVKTPTNSERNISSAAALGDATMNVHGTFDVDGYLYTTASGANIFSSIEDAGTVKFNTNAGGGGNLYQWNNDNYVSYACTSAQLKNGKMNNTTHQYSATYNPFTPTTGTTASDANPKSFCFIDMDGDGLGEWVSLVADGCFVRDDAVSPAAYYAKPKEYVKLLNGNVENTEQGKKHTYSYRALDDTLLICMTDCQWWKVVPVEESDSLFYCPTNGIYYFYDDSDPDPEEHAWAEKRFKVKWNNWDGSNIATYEQAYKSIPSYQGANPQRAYTDYYTYTFIGWMPEVGPVMGDVTYTAQFEEHDRKYTISFYDENNALIESQQCKMGQIPVCYNMPEKDGMRLVWNPLIHAVNGNADYYATFTAEEKTAYTITFLDFDNTVLQSGEVAVGTIPEYDETNGIPSKPAIAGAAFEWSGWTPEIVPVDGDAAYSPTFTQVPAKYTITWQDENGDEIEYDEWGYGEMPVCSNPPTKAPTEAEYYEVIWNPIVSVVTGNQTYRANGFTTYKNTLRLTVSAGANGSVSAVNKTQGNTPMSASDIYEFGDVATITATPNTGYHFVRWNDGNTDSQRDVTVNAAITLQAEFAINTYTITWTDYDNSSLGSTTVNHGEMPVHAAPTREATAEYSYVFKSWEPAIEAASSDATYEATYTATKRSYTVRFVYNNGTPDQVTVYEYGETPVPMTANPEKQSTFIGVVYTFSGWQPEIEVVTGDITYTAQFESEVTTLVAGTSDAASVKDLIITQSGMEASSIVIEKDGSVTVPAGITLTTGDLILESTTAQSGQLIGAPRLTAAHAYFDVKFNGEAGTANRTWYAISVPWEVDAENGIFWKEGNRKLVLGRDFDIVWYDGAERALNGDGFDCWKYVEYETDKMMHPGKMYMMYFGSQFKTVRFAMNDGASIRYSEDANAVTTVETYDLGTGNATDDDWNGIGNPSVCHAYLNAGVSYGQILNNGSLDDYQINHPENNPVYQTVALSSYKFVVGKPVFVQATANQSIAVNPAISGALAAPKRDRANNMPEGIDAVFAVTIGTETNHAADNLFIQATEDEKEDTYVIGQDLAKGGVAKTIPQLWVNRYNAKLSVNTQTLTNEIAEYPLTISVPVAGEYTIAIHNSQFTIHNEDYALYLTLNGEAIWNLSDGAYTFTLPQGNTAEYGLRIRAKAPEVATGIEEAIVDAQGDTRKVMLDQKVYIIRGNKMYSVDGQMVK